MPTGWCSTPQRRRYRLKRPFNHPHLGIICFNSLELDRVSIATATTTQPGTTSDQRACAQWKARYVSRVGLHCASRTASHVLFPECLGTLHSTPTFETRVEIDASGRAYLWAIESRILARCTSVSQLQRWRSISTDAMSWTS